MVRALLVDDEHHAIRSLEILLGECCPSVEIVGKARSVDEALALVYKLNPNLVFLDVEIPPKTGFDFLEECCDMNFEVVFITAYNQYAVKAFKNSAIDYILKPIDVDELKESVRKATEMIDSKNSSKARYSILFENLKEIIPHKMVLKTTEGYKYIDTKQIVTCNFEFNSVSFSNDDNTTITFNLNYSDLKPSMESRGFLCINGETYVNLAKVVRVDRNEGGKIITTNGQSLPIRKMTREEFIEKLEDFNNSTK
jgi:two-component system LytT family response regulator